MSQRVVSRSPQHPSEIVADVDSADPATIESIVEDGRCAQGAWANLPAAERARLLNSLADGISQAQNDLIELGIREVGKPRAEMTGEVARSVAIVRYYAQQVLDPNGLTYPSPDGRSTLMSVRRPHGVVGLITPWNFPYAIPLWKLAPALACGNAVLLKPAPQATATALRLAEVISPHLPADLVQIVPGGAAVGTAVTRFADATSFTGSVGAGAAVIANASSQGHIVQAEMGGQNASIVLPDADVELAATTIAAAAMGYAGQKCTATSRVITVGPQPHFKEALQTAITNLSVGDPSETATFVGPVIEEAAQERVRLATAEAISLGARALCGDGVVDDEGWYVKPVLLDDVDPNQRVAQEEIFGPFAVYIEARTVDEAVEIANGVRYGLVAAIFSQDLEQALRIGNRLDVGLLKINAATAGVELYTPFGGQKDSSFGPREQGKAALDFYSWSQTITVSPSRKNPTS